MEYSQHTDSYMLHKSLLPNTSTRRSSILQHVPSQKPPLLLLTSESFSSEYFAPRSHLQTYSSPSETHSSTSPVISTRYTTSRNVDPTHKSDEFPPFISLGVTSFLYPVHWTTTLLEAQPGFSTCSDAGIPIYSRLRTHTCHSYKSRQYYLYTLAFLLSNTIGGR